ncbi:MAG: type II toxin-antitoxin system prevent-host-death family antitoxin [Chloroflexi bacterium]|nr:type II toxin-antitoxin system prevent-host-death family antitoxin [Chloroflexota bacterium]
MERIGIRELRNETSKVVRRARSGERIIVTIDGIPAAQLVPLDDGPRERTIEELIATGALIPARSTRPPLPATPIPAPPGPTTTEILREHRDR